MSKRKYAKNVSSIVYGWEYGTGMLGNSTQTSNYRYCHFPVRIIRESFYRKLVNGYRKYEIALCDGRIIGE